MSNTTTDPRHDFLPARESDLVAWSANFRNRIVADPGRFGLVPAQASAYSTLHDALAARHAAAVNPNLNTKAAVAAKNMAKKALKADARALARIVQASPGVNDALRAELGLTVPDPHMTRITRPDGKPELSVVSSSGKTVRIRLRDTASPDRRRRPAGTTGAVVMSYTAQPGAMGAGGAGDGEELPPEDMSKWSLCGIATRQVFDVNFGADVPATARVWITAMWFNARGQLGTPARAQATRVGDGVAKLRLAA